MVILTYTRPYNEFEKYTVLGNPKSIYNLVCNLEVPQKNGVIKNLKATNLGNDISIPLDKGLSIFLSYCEQPWDI